jgi:hypothetical protein
MFYDLILFVEFHVTLVFRNKTFWLFGITLPDLYLISLKLYPFAWLFSVTLLNLF